MQSQSWHARAGRRCVRDHLGPKRMLILTQLVNSVIDTVNWIVLYLQVGLFSSHTHAESSSSSSSSPASSASSSSVGMRSPSESNWSSWSKNGNLSMKQCPEHPQLKYIKWTIEILKFSSGDWKLKFEAIFWSEHIFWDWLFTRKFNWNLGFNLVYFWACKPCKPYNVLSISLWRGLINILGWTASTLLGWKAPTLGKAFWAG